MGMYTEVVAACDLRNDTPLIAIEAIESMIDRSLELPDLGPDCHPFFLKPRYGQVANKGSRLLHPDCTGDTYVLTLHGNLKNYHGEVESFFRWLVPYVHFGAGADNLVGFSLYEEDTFPTLYYAKDNGSAPSTLVVLTPTGVADIREEPQTWTS